MNTCKTCKWWGVPGGHWANRITDPEDFTNQCEEPYDHLSPEGYRPNADPESHLCGSPKLRFFQRPSGVTEASVFDGSDYMAELLTAEEFGCVNWEVRK